MQRKLKLQNKFSQNQIQIIIILIQIIQLFIVNKYIYNFLLVEKIEKNTDIILNSEICSPEIYLIFEKGNNSENGSFLITINHIKSNRNRNCRNNISDFIYCDSIEYSKCGSCEDEKCSLIQCGKEKFFSNNIIFEKYDEICTPKNITHKEKEEICLNFDEVNSFRQFNECIYELDTKFNYMNSSIYLIIILIVLCIILLIFYYNKYLIANNKKPFNVPIFFTETFFPNINNDNEYELYIMKNNETNLPEKYNNI